jgi:hypothetical protein
MVEETKIVNKKYAQNRAKQEIASDYYEGLLNPAFIIEKYMKTVTKNGYRPFVLFPRQREIVEAYETYRHNIVTKPRQTGVSTTTAAYLAVKAAYTDPEKPELIVIAANKWKSAKNFLGLIRKYMADLPSWIWGKYYDHDKAIEGHIDGKGSTETLTLLNGTRIIAVATSPDTLRGLTPTFLILDEAAYIKSFAKELYTASMASLIIGGKMIIISTPNGKDELYYKVYVGAKSGENNFNLVRLEWFEDPRYNVDLEWHKTYDDGKIEILKEELFTFESFASMVKKGYKAYSSWYRDTCAALNNDKLAIARELDVKFEGSAGTVVEQEWLTFHEKYNVIEPLVKCETEDRLWIFEEPIEGHQYIMGVDVSSGNADDYSSMVIIDTLTGFQVLEFKGKIRPNELAVIVNKYGLLYNSLTVIDTTGGYGDLLVFSLEELNYGLLYYDKGKQDHLKKHPSTQVDKNKLVAGYKIGTFRPQIIGKLTAAIEANEFKIRSQRLIGELETFVWVNGRPDHMSGFNDDVIFAAALALWILETEFKSLARAKEKTTSILSVWAGTSNKEVKKVESNLPVQLNQNRNQPMKNVQDPMGQYSWLLGR